MRGLREDKGIELSYNEADKLVNEMIDEDIMKTVKLSRRGKLTDSEGNEVRLHIKYEVDPRTGKRAKMIGCESNFTEEHFDEAIEKAGQKIAKWEAERDRLIAAKAKKFGVNEAVDPTS